MRHVLATLALVAAVTFTACGDSDDGPAASDSSLKRIHIEFAFAGAPGELGHRLGLTSGGVTALAGRLIDAGHVERAPHPRDRRMRILTATPEGDAHLAGYLEPVLAPADRVLAWLTPADAALIERFLDSLVALKDHAAASTPGPEPEHSSEPYSPALLM